MSLLPPRIFATPDPERHSLLTPSYAYGWVVSRTELNEALFHGEGNPSTFLGFFDDAVSSQFQLKWINEGLDQNNYNPDTPGVVEAGDEHLFIYMACNDSDEVMDSIMADHPYHEEVRKCLANMETLKLHPAWFRWDVKGIPMGFKPDSEAEALNQTNPD